MKNTLMIPNNFIPNIKIEFGYDDLDTITDNGRKYVTPQGNQYPSITTILGSLNKEGIEKWKQRVGEKEAKRVSHHAATRGTCVHELCEKYLKNIPIDTKQVKNPMVLSNFKSLIPIFEYHISAIICLEKALYSDKLEIAGRVDCIAKFNGILSVIDFKTSAKPKKKEWIESYFLQQAAYAIMFHEQTGIYIDQLVTIISVDYNKPQLFVENLDQWYDKLIEIVDNYKTKTVN